MRKNALNVVIFMVLAVGLFFLWQQADKNLPKRDIKKEEAKQVLPDDPKKDESAKNVPAKNEKDEKKDAKKPDGPKEPPRAAAPPAPPPEPPTLIELGDKNYYLKVLLSTRGGGVQQIVLPKFDQADRLGREVKVRDADDNPTTESVPLYLVPGVPQHRGRFLNEEYRVPALKPGKVLDPIMLSEPSFTVFHYADEENPDPLLGEKNWKVVSEDRPEGGKHSVVFETELGDPYFLKITKIYTLNPGDYHIGLRIEVKQLPGREKGKGLTRLQIAGPHGLPIEGEWYTNTYRNAIIGWTDSKGTPQRRFESAASIGNKRGGDKEIQSKFKYMVVATQYFASGVAVNDRSKDEGAEENPWVYVRATTELPFNKLQDPNQANFDDVTVRGVSDKLDLEPGKTKVYSYLLYNGPAKVRLLGLMSGDRAVDPDLVERYKDNLGLQTITDFHSDNPLGWVANKIWWTDLVLATTNLMHWFLAVIHKTNLNWALSIVVLTILVRLMLFYPSRKQTAMSMKMMELQKQLQPELEKLQEKYKDDMGAYNREKMRLMMARGINPAAPLGGCLLFLAQAPIMMGLYFCLQESIFFRLDHFLWIDNLAAPDMLKWWGEHVPYISTPEDIGSFYYLGPYFNLLPLLAVSLMLYQQSKMMPPSTDPQAEQQRMMMKVMMVMMAVFFYKVAAGLALYFIVSTGWAIIERQFIPKPKIVLGGVGGGGTGTGGGGTDGPFPPGSPNGKPMSPAEAAIAAAREQKPKGFLGRLREALKKRMEEMQKQADEQSRRQIRNDPNRPGGQTDGPQGLGPGQGNQNRRDKKKRRRK